MPITQRALRFKKLDLSKVNSDGVDKDTVDNLQLIERKLDFMANQETVLVQSVFKWMERLSEVESMLR